MGFVVSPRARCNPVRMWRAVGAVVATALMLFPVLSLFGLPAGPCAVLDLTADFAPCSLPLGAPRFMCPQFGSGSSDPRHVAGKSSGQKDLRPVRLPRLICPMQRSSYMFRVHHQVFPGLAVSRGSQVSPPSCGPRSLQEVVANPCRLWRACIFTAVRCQIGSSPRLHLEFSDSFLLDAIFSAEPVSDRWKIP